MLAHSLAKTLGLSFRPIQYTSDLLPAETTEAVTSAYLLAQYGTSNDAAVLHLKNVVGSIHLSDSTLQ